MTVLSALKGSRPISPLCQFEQSGGEGERTVDGLVTEQLGIAAFVRQFEAEETVMTSVREDQGGPLSRLMGPRLFVWLFPVHRATH